MLDINTYKVPAQVNEGGFYFDFCLSIIIFVAVCVGSIQNSTKIEQLEKKIKSDGIYIQWLHKHSNEHILITIPGTQPQGPAAD
jgi:hypothetical protein